MIPVRVLVRDFLCYDGAGDGGVEFDFEGSPLWSVSGDNGAGKSAIFDAITYALFGRHRGGAQRDSRLIRRGALECEAAFEFRLGDQLYRVRRTVGRPKGATAIEPKTWQAAWFDPEVGDWRPIPGTEKAAGLDRWVQEKLGFGFDTFVASVLLLQGQSDRLIMANPKDRFDVLSGILEMEPYKRLEQAAADRAKGARDQAKFLEPQLAGLAPVTEEEIKAVEKDLKAAEGALAQAQKVAAQAEVVVNDAQRYQVLAADLDAAQQRLEELDQILRDAERIRSEFDEWCKLSQTLPKLRAAIHDLLESERLAAAAKESHEAAAKIDLHKLEREAEEASKAEELEQDRTRRRRDEHRELASALPIWQEVLRCRQDLEQRQRDLYEQGTLQEWERRAKEVQSRLNEQQKVRDKAEAARNVALNAKADGEAALRQAEQELRNLREAKDEAVCSRCRQPITPEHIQRELREAERAVEEANAQMAKRAAALESADLALKAAAERLPSIADELSDFRAQKTAASRAVTEKEKAETAVDQAVVASSGLAPDLRGGVVESPLEEAHAALADHRRRASTLEAEVGDAERRERTARQVARDAQNAVNDARSELQSLEVNAARLTTQADGLRQRAEVRLADVDTVWRERALARDQDFVGGLAARLESLAGVEEAHRALQQATTERDEVSRKIEASQEGLEKIPAQHRIGPEEAESRKGAALDRRAAAQRERDEARDRLRGLEQVRRTRRQLEEKARQLHRRRALYTRLGELLGRNGLQGYLMDAALTDVSRLANETLSRISGGQLQVRLGRETSARKDEEIVIQATDLASSDDPLDVQFISGSQKFRTSVALAAAIGQYAGASKSSVRSLIIDEGFGSLDSHGRQEMIDELQNLSRVMDRIIVVSHQEDFQDRTLFPTGYVLRKAGQRTVVERFV